MILKMVLAVLVGCDPALASLFTPAHPRWGQYEVCARAEPLDLVLGEQDGTFAQPELLEALDAFGAGGRYDRARVARLYGGRRARVARGWRLTGGQFESITLISPHPDATLSRLDGGTLVIRYRLVAGGL